MPALPEWILTYCEEHSTADSSLLADLIRYTHANTEHPNMISGPGVGNLLRILISLGKARNLLEVGTFTGYAALVMAEASGAQARIHTLELDERHADIAQSFFDRSPYGGKITIHRGPALDSLAALPAGTFDLAFIDADKVNYPAYYRRCLDLMRTGGIIALDNMLWGGAVVTPEDEDSQALRDTAEIIQADNRVLNTLVSVRDGVMICQKQSD